MHKKTALKIKRNDSCYCGSGKKYKKCCLSTDKTEPSSLSNVGRIENEPSSNSPLMTTTGEFYMPARLYYLIHDKPALIRHLEKIRCVCWDSEDRFFINYEKESKNIGLSIKHNRVPDALYPVILGYGHLLSDNQLHVDTRSFERCARLVEFMDKHINRSILEIKYVASYNQMRRVINKKDLQSIMTENYDDIFSDSNIKFIDPEVEMKRLKEATSHEADPARKLEKLFDFIESEEKIFPIIEKYPVHYYTDGIHHLEFGLRVRMKVAFEHFLGNSGYCMTDAIEEAVASSRKRAFTD